MNVNNPVLHRALTSDFAWVDAHVVTKGEYDDLPELDDAMLARAKVNRGEHLVSATPRKLSPNLDASN